jgi:DNA invertase Pin-like site-specific DNA recombinase
MLRLFAYIRVSTTRQGTLGVSLAEQRDRIEQFCTRENLTVICWFEEQETAAKRGRPVWNDMVKRIRRGEADGIVIHKIDRSARNLKDWADLGELIDAGVVVRFVNENLDLGTRGGRLTADIQAVVAADFIRNSREEVKKGLYGRLKQGIYPFAAPVGYRDCGKGKPKTLDPVRAPLVKAGFDLYATGTYTLDTLREELARRGLTNRNGTPLSRDGIWLMLTNPFYIGIMRLKKSGETFPGLHEPLVAAHVFEKVDAVLNGRSFTRVHKHDYLFRRRFTCKTCGHALTASTQKGFVYYRCHTKNCEVTCVREELIEIAVLDAFRKVSFPVELRAAIHAALKQQSEGFATAQENTRKSVRASLERVDGRLARLTDAYVDGTLERDLFLDRKAELLATRARLRDQLAEAEADPTRHLRHVEEKLQLAENAEIQYELRSPSERRRLLEKLTCNRTVSGKNVDVPLLPPFDRLAEMIDVGKCAHYPNVVRTANAIIDVFIADRSDKHGSDEVPNVH